MQLQLELARAYMAVGNVQADGHGVGLGNPAAAIESYGRASALLDRIPTAGEGTFYNLGASILGTDGGHTAFYNPTSAGHSKLYAYGGASGCNGGKVSFSGGSTAGAAHVYLSGNGELDVSYHTGELALGSLDLNGGLINTQVGKSLTTLSVAELELHSTDVYFEFNGDFSYEEGYIILKASSLKESDKYYFKNNSPQQDVTTDFTVDDGKLIVTFYKKSEA